MNQIEEQQFKYLSNLLDPISVLDFFEKYFEKDYLKIRVNNKIIFDDTLSALSDILDRENLRWPEVRLVNDGAQIQKEEYTFSYLYNNRFEFRDIIDKDSIDNYYKSGSSIVITHAHKLSKMIKNTNLTIGNDFGLDTHINIYITPPNSQGYKLHFDTHDVLVLQLSGSKMWEVYNNVGLPPKDTNFMEHLSLCDDKVKKEVKLMQYDLLYLPRGTFHNVFTGNEHSVHATIGIIPRTISDCMKEKIDNGSFGSELERSITNWNRLSIFPNMAKQKTIDGIYDILCESGETMKKQRTTGATFLEKLTK